MKLHIVTDQGELIYTVDLPTFNPENPLARSSLIHHIHKATKLDGDPLPNPRNHKQTRPIVTETEAIVVGVFASLFTVGILAAELAVTFW